MEEMGTLLNITVLVVAEGNGIRLGGREFTRTNEDGTGPWTRVYMHGLVLGLGRLEMIKGC